MSKTVKGSLHIVVSPVDVGVTSIPGATEALEDLAKELGTSAEIDVPIHAGAVEERETDQLILDHLASYARERDLEHELGLTPDALRRSDYYFNPATGQAWCKRINACREVRDGHSTPWRVRRPVGDGTVEAAVNVVVQHDFIHEPQGHPPTVAPGRDDHFLHLVLAPDMTEYRALEERAAFARGVEKVMTEFGATWSDVPLPTDGGAVHRPALNATIGERLGAYSLENRMPEALRLTDRLERSDYYHDVAGHEWCKRTERCNLPTSVPGLPNPTDGIAGVGLLIDVVYQHPAIH